MESRYKPQLDGIRAFCIIFTIFNHVPNSPWFINGDVGVDVFFALSGWLITWLMLEERRRTGFFNLPAFYIRRLFRIAPLYFFTIGLYASTSVFKRIGDGPAQFEAAFPYLLTFNSEYRGLGAGTMMGHAWTLGIEEKFYFAWPLLLLLTRFRAGRAGLLAFAGVAALFFFFDSLKPINILRGYAGLSFGAAAAVVVHRLPALQQRLRERPIGGWVLAAMAACYAISVLFTVRGLWDCTMSLAGAALMASYWFHGDQPTARFLSLRPLAWLGRLTFALYLIHPLAINAVELLFARLHVAPGVLNLFCGAYALSIAGAWALHVGVEKPLIRIGRSLAGRSTGRIAVTKEPA